MLTSINSAQGLKHINTIILDCDGTSFFNGELLKSVINPISKFLENKYNDIIFLTGRPDISVRNKVNKYFPSESQEIKQISFASHGGGLSYFRNNKILDIGFDKEITKEIIRYLKINNIESVIFQSNKVMSNLKGEFISWYSNFLGVNIIDEIKSDGVVRGIEIQYKGLNGKLEEFKKEFKKVLNVYEIDVKDVNQKWKHITPMKVNKLISIREYLEHKENANYNTILFIGDGDNDREALDSNLFKTVVMGNAKRYVKELPNVDYITSNCEDGGVAQVINSILYNNN